MQSNIITVIPVYNGERFIRKTLESAAAERQGFVIERLDSTVRSARVYGTLSRLIRQTGRGEMSALDQPACLLHGLLFQLRERAMNCR